MRLISIDCEASGPCPGLGDVLSFGAVIVEPGFKHTYRSLDMKPIHSAFDPGAYAAIGITRAEHEAYSHTVHDGFMAFSNWIRSVGGYQDRMTMVSDNPAFDWQWINWGFQFCLGSNPLGFSARRIGDLWAGMNRKPNDHSSWKRLRRTPHTHDPLDDAMGNAEALIEILNRMATETNR